MKLGFGEERHHAAIYLNALRTDNVAIVNEHERFGSDPRHIIMNRREYDRRLLFGFVGTELDKNDWLKRPEFVEVERIEFAHKEGFAVSNYVTIGRGANGKWSYGASYSTGGSGGGYGLNVWGEVFDSRKDRLASALAELIDNHHKSATRLKNITTNFNATLSNIIVKQAKDMYDTLMGKKAVQLSPIW